ncbi:hypothetical protein LguiA_013233 [Lonicera macranthoides]
MIMALTFGLFTLLLGYFCGSSYFRFLFYISFNCLAYIVRLGLEPKLSSFLGKNKREVKASSIVIYFLLL